MLVAKLLCNRPQASEDKNWCRRQEASQQGAARLVESLDGEPGVEERRKHWRRLSLGGPAH